MKTLLTIIIIALFLPSCATAPKNQLTPASVNRIDELIIYSHVPQDEITPFYNPDSYKPSLNILLGTFLVGLIPTLINNAIVDTIERNVIDGAIYHETEPLLIASESYNFRNSLAESIEKHVPAIGNVSSIKVIPTSRIFTDDDLLKKINDLDENQAILDLTSQYKLSDAGKSISTITQLRLFLGSSLKKETIESDYQNIYATLSKKYGQGEEQSISLWSDNNAELYKNTLASAIEATSLMLAYDLSLKEDINCLRRYKKDVITPAGFYDMEGFLTNGDNGYYFIKDDKGFLFWLNQSPGFVRPKKSQIASCEKQNIAGT